MATLVFDIETVAVPVEQFDDAQREYLFRRAEMESDEDLRQAAREETERFMALWPFTAQCVCIAMINAESDRGQVLYIADEFDQDEDESDDAAETVKFVPCMDEGDLLAAFWDAARHYERIVTFNGRGFDVPFVYLRSALLNVPISRKDWLGYRFATEPHCDLAEQLSFYNVSGRDGAARRFNLDFYCKSFGIASPKAEGITGMDVGRLLEERQFRAIADYCVRDVRATVQLFRIWKERLSGIK